MLEFFGQHHIFQQDKSKNRKRRLSNALTIDQIIKETYHYEETDLCQPQSMNGLIHTNSDHTSKDKNQLHYQPISESLNLSKYKGGVKEFIKIQDEVQNFNILGLQIKAKNNKKTQSKNQPKETIQALRRQNERLRSMGKKTNDENSYNPKILKGNKEQFQEKHGQEDLVIMNNKNQDGFHQFIKDKIIKDKNSYQFSIKVRNSKQNKILVGVVIRSRKNKKSSYDSGQAITFNGNQKSIALGKGKKELMKDGFGEGNIVTVRVSIKKDKIEWLTDGKKIGEHTIGKFRYEQMCPLVEMYNHKDCIEWIEY